MAMSRGHGYMSRGTLRIGVGIPRGNARVGWSGVGDGVGFAVRSPRQARVGWGGVLPRDP